MKTTKLWKACLFWAVFGILSLFLETGAYASSQQQSGVTTGTIIDQVRDIINEQTADFWAETELLHHVNDGIVFIASTSYGTQTTESITLSAGVSQYAISGNYFDIEGVVYNAGSTTYNKGLLRGNIQMIGNVEDVDEPTYWAPFAGSVIILPTPSSTVTGHICTIYYYLRPSDVGLTDTIPLPAIYDYPLVLYAASRALMKAPGKINEATGLMSQCMTLLSTYGVNINMKEKDSEEVIAK